MYDTCPVFPSFPGNYQLETCLGWKIPTTATSDYFNSCAVGTQVAVPSNAFGFQVPYSGNAYCGGFIQYGEPPFTPQKQWYVEYIQSELLQPLLSGHEYEFSCRVVISDIIRDYAYWKYGAYFSQTAISRSDDRPFSGIIPQVMNTAGNYLTDTLNWQEIKGKFIAQGGEQYVTIGFFTDTIAPDSLVQMPYSMIEPRYTGAYYFVDGCSVNDTGRELVYPNIFSPNGDNQNDEWKPFISEGETIEIYDRWGIKVYELSATNQAWDGRTTSGQMCVDGVYFYLLKEKNNNSKKGFIQLVR